MAKSVLKVRAKKTRRVTKSEAYLVNQKYLGEEPVKVSGSELSRALNWYNAMVEADEARQFILDFYKDNKQMISQIKRVPDDRLPYTSAWVFRIKERGGAVDDSMIARAKERVDRSLNFTVEIKEPKIVGERPSIQDRIKDRVDDLIGDVEKMLDLGEEIQMYDWLRKNEIPAAHAKKISEYYMPIADEIMYAIQEDNEGYERYTKKQLGAKLAVYVAIVQDCDRYSGNVKKARAPRKKKAPTAQKLLKHFKYQKESTEYKLKSIDPTQIIGAQELWVFNTNNKVLTVFRARGPAGLTVKRSAIDGYDSEASVSKRVGRKTEDIIRQVLTGGKIVLRKLMDGVSSSPTKLAERLSEQVILLRKI